MTAPSRLAVASACLFLPLFAIGCQQHSFQSCDITTRACQEDVYYRLLELRGDGYDPFGGLPPVDVISESQYRDLLLQEQADLKAQTRPSPGDKALALLHFTSNGPTGPGPDAGASDDAGAGSSTLEDQVTHTYAFYDPQQKTITIISHPSQVSATAREEGMVTLAHELVHALQSRQMDLNKKDFESSDDYLAYHTLVEGDARLYEYLFVNEVLPLLGRPATDALAMPGRELDTVYADPTAEGTPLFVAQLLMYSLGATYEALEYRSGGNAAIRHGYARTPRQTVGFLLADDGKPQRTVSGDPCPGLYSTSLPTSGDTVGADQLGALLLYTFLRGWQVDHPTALATAQSWAGDYLYVQGNADLSVVAVSWRIGFTAPPPGSLSQILNASGELTATQGATSLQVTATDSPTKLTWKPATSCP
jgi:hypothetical protein